MEHELKYLPVAIPEESKTIPVLLITHDVAPENGFKYEFVVLDDEKYGTVIGKALGDRADELRGATMQVIKISKDELVVADYNRALVTLGLSPKDAELYAKGQYEGTLSQ